MNIRETVISCSGVPQVLSGPWAARTYYVVFKGKLRFGSPLKIKSSHATVSEDDGVLIWDEKLYLEYMRTTDITIQIIAPHTIGKSVIAETTEKAVDLHSKPELKIPLCGGDGYCTLQLAIYKDDDAWGEVSTVLSRLPSPARLTSSPLLSRVDGATSSESVMQSTATHVWKTLLDKIDDVADAVEALSQIHPYAQIAWSVIGAGYKLAKNQQDRDDKLASLIETMQNTYAAVSATKSLSRMRPEQEAALISLMKQTTECGYFVIEYMRKTFVTRAVHGFLSNVDKTIEDYCSRFVELRTAFVNHTSIATQVLVQLVLDKTETLEATVELVDMPFTKTARWRSGKQCLQGTRTEMISCILNWANLSEYSSSRVLLLTGSAGTGKSSVAHSVARYLNELSRLGASYCFEKSDTVNHRPGLLFPTLARDLADCHPLFKRKLAHIARSATLRATPDLDDQFENLILKPLSELEYIGPLIIVIDALDESASPKDRRKLLEILARRLDELPVNIRFVMTSRLEDDIMQSLGAARYVSRLDMGQIPSSSTITDITKFISSRLVGIDGQPVQVFKNEHYRHLAEKSEGLFQWAAVVCDMILHGEDMDYYLADEDMLSHYERFSSLSAESTSTGVLDDLYRDILLRSVPMSQAQGRREGSKHLQTFRKLLSPILAAVQPLSARSLFRLLLFSESDQRVSTSMLRRLGALLTGVHDVDSPIRLLHTSFRDFLRDPSASEAYYIDPDASHPSFALGCAQVLNMELRFNICALETSYALNEEVEDMHARLIEHVSAPLSYATQHWGNHVAAASSLDESLMEAISFFLHDRFLFWLEVLSLSGSLHTALPALAALRDKSIPANLDALVADYVRFIRVFNYPIRSSAPHIYISAYALAPSTSLVRLQSYSLALQHLVRVSGPWDHWPKTDVIIDTHDHILSVAFSPDGRCIASSSTDNEVSLWNAETGWLICEPLTGHVDTVAAVAFSPDGYSLVSGSHDTTLRIWDIGRAELGITVGMQLMGHSDRVNTVAFAPGSHCIASGSDDMSVCIWKPDSGTYVPMILREHVGGVLSVMFSPDGQRLVSASTDGSVYLWGIESGVLLQKLLGGHMMPVTSLAFSPDGATVVSGSMDASLCLWDANTGRFRDRLHGHTRAITSLAYSPNSNRIVSASDDQLLCVWDMAQDAIGNHWQASRFDGHTGSPRSVAFSPDGRQIVSGGEDRTIRVWLVDNQSGVDFAFDETDTSVNSVFISSEGTRYVVRSHDQSVRVRHVVDDMPIGRPLQDQVGEITCVAFSHDGRLVALGGEDCGVNIWDVGTGLHEVGLRGHSGPISSIAFFPDARHFVSASHDATLRIWDLTRQCLAMNPLEGCTKEITSMAVSLDGRMLVAGSVDGSIRIWDTQRGRLSRTINGEPHIPIRAVAVAPNARFIAGGGDDCSVRICNAQTGQLLWRSSLGHSAAVTSVVFTSDGQLVISGSLDCRIRIWKNNGALADEPLVGHTGAITSVVVPQSTVASTPSHIVSSSTDRTVRVWSTTAHGHNTQRAYLFSKNPLHALTGYPSLELARRSSEPNPQAIRFTLTSDWWIKDETHDPPRVLLWIPPEMRDGLYMPNTAHISGQRTYQLDFSDFAHGARWADCWKGEGMKYQ
ncbi:unnamed protein product [Peniophora sp. CBMAI 1063]|nr:unnamed protein product [Peniophora sp. CBMAI 1063]